MTGNTVLALPPLLHAPPYSLSLSLSLLVAICLSVSLSVKRREIIYEEEKERERERVEQTSREMQGKERTKDAMQRTG